MSENDNNQKNKSSIILPKVNNKSKNPFSQPSAKNGLNKKPTIAQKPGNTWKKQ